MTCSYVALAGRPFSWTRSRDELFTVRSRVGLSDTSTLDYCNSLYYKLPESQLSRLQQIQNSFARTVVKAPKSCHIIRFTLYSHPTLSLLWLRINKRIEYKLLSLT